MVYINTRIAVQSDIELRIADLSTKRDSSIEVILDIIQISDSYTLRFSAFYLLHNSEVLSVPKIRTAHKRD